MPDPDLRRVREIFERVRALPPDERLGELDNACDGDESVRHEVEMLLRSAPSTDFLEGGLGALAEPAPPNRLGRFELIRRIAAGGMGTVYEAQQDQPERRVALKVLHHFAAPPDVIARFRREALVLGHLGHPNIAQVFEAGLDDSSGVPVAYIAMELVEDGASIVDFVIQNSLSRVQRIHLFLAVCDAVHFGHQKGVIHRDLKPDNILVDSEGRPRVIDFGIARVTNADLALASIQTSTGQVIGTLRYMSPEQFEGRPEGVDSRVDVYSLGVVLYEMLTGEYPYEVEGSSPLDLPRVVRESRPITLSTWNPRLRGDLEIIVSKAIAKRADDRYGSVIELAAELRRYLNGEAIDARKENRLYVLRRAVIRHRIALSVLVFVLLVLVGSAATLGVLYNKSETARRSEERSSYENQIALAYNAVEDFSPAEARRILATCKPGRRNWEWSVLSGRVDDSVLTYEGHDGIVTDSAATRDGETLATCAEDGVVHVWSADSGETLHTLRLPGKPARCYVDFGADDRWLASAHRRELVLWDVEQGVELSRIDAIENPRCLSLSPCGRYVAAGGIGCVRVWALPECELHARFSMERQETGVFAVTFSRDGGYLSAVAQGGEAKIWDLEANKVYQSIDRVAMAGLRREAGRTRERGYAVVLDFEKDLWVVGSDDHYVRMWKPHTGEFVSSERFPDQVLDVSLIPSGKKLLVAAGAAVHVRDLVDGFVPEPLRGHEGRIQSLTVLDDERVLTTGEDGTAKVWNLNRRAGLRRLGRHYGETYDLECVPGRGLLASVGKVSIIRIRDQGTGALEGDLEGHDGRVNGLASSPEGDRLASISDDGTFRIWDLESNEERARIALGNEGKSVAWGRGHVATVLEDGSLNLWASPRFQPVARVSLGDSGYWQMDSVLDFSPNGQVLVTGGARARVWNVPELESLATLDCSSSQACVVRFSPDGETIAVGTRDGRVRLWDWKANGIRAAFTAGHSWVTSISFSPDGSRIATACFHDTRLRVWSAETVNLLITLPGADRYQRVVEFSRDGKLLIASGNDGRLSAWGGEDDR